MLTAENYREVVGALSALKACAEQLERENGALSGEVARLAGELTRLEAERRGLTHSVP